MCKAPTNTLKFSDDFKQIDIILNEESFEGLKINNILHEGIVCNIEIVKHAIVLDCSWADAIYCYFKPIDGKDFYRLIFKKGQHNLVVTDDYLALENQAVAVNLSYGDKTYNKSGTISIDSWFPPFSQATA